MACSYSRRASSRAHASATSLYRSAASAAAWRSLASASRWSASSCRRCAPMAAEAPRRSAARCQRPRARRRRRHLTCANDACRLELRQRPRTASVSRCASAAVSLARSSAVSDATAGGGPIPADRSSDGASPVGNSSRVSRLRESTAVPPPDAVGCPPGAVTACLLARAACPVSVAISALISAAPASLLAPATAPAPSWCTSAAGAGASITGAGIACARATCACARSVPISRIISARRSRKASAWDCAAKSAARDAAKSA
mmetsp:Transcript_5316/g.17724  ORF Transcript_5316/g.17724 Transcript_5316/m.17724 type:complete len:260 (-) Transcript_5316:55-834(-)